MDALDVELVIKFVITYSLLINNQLSFTFLIFSSLKLFDITNNLSKFDVLMFIYSRIMHEGRKQQK